MSPSEPEKTRTEVVGIFDDPDSLQSAIDDLLSAGFDRAELSLLAGETAVEEKLGHAYRKVEEIEDDITIPREAYVSTESIGDAEGGLIGGLVYVGAVAAAGAVVATGGTLAAIVGAVAAAGGAGALAGSVLATLVGRHHAHYLQEQLDRGGLLLWVRTWDKAREARAKEILTRHSAHDVHAHSLSTALALRPGR
jgi:outer membrane lipoprotein SlyB